jgi:murein peptide amidase A
MKKLRALVLASISGFVVLPVSSVSAESPTPIEVRVIGYSVNNEPLIAKRFGTPGGKVVVAVGSIHGNEKTGIRIVREMQLQPVSPEYDLWVIDTANPDGNRANTRQNANGVDLNRNFPKFWSKKTCPSKYCSGKRPGSEPETRALMKFFKEISPQLVVFYHSEGEVLVLPSNGVAKPRAVRAYSGILSLQITNDFCGLSDCSGNATQYLTATIPSSTSFVVELPCHDRCLKDAVIQLHIQGFWSAAEQA